MRKLVLIFRYNYNQFRLICFSSHILKFKVPATRAAAEQVLTQFRQIPQVLPACQYILGNFESNSSLARDSDLVLIK